MPLPQNAALALLLLPYVHADLPKTLEEPLTDILNKLEPLLSARPRPPNLEKEFRSLANTIHGHAYRIAPFYGHPNWKVVRWLFVLRFVLEAASVKATTARPWHVSDSPDWVYARMTGIRRAQLMAVDEGLRDGQADKLGLPAEVLTPSTSWLQAVHIRWPMANRLPSKTLMTLGCAAHNMTLQSLLTPGQATAERCRTDLGVVNVRRWRYYVSKGQYMPPWPTLAPQLTVSPVQIGRAQHKELLSIILERDFTDPSGLVLEFGVSVGTSLNMIARRLQTLGGGRVYGFDSFRGLPERWSGGASGFLEGGGDLPEGWFSQKTLPKVEPNAELVEGWFNETLPAFVKAQQDSNGAQLPKLSFLHMDADLYSSTIQVLNAVGPWLRPGSIVLFDDFLNYPSFTESGIKAWGEFLQRPDSPSKVDVLGAPWVIYDEADVDEKTTDQAGNRDYERAVAFRIVE